MVKSQITRQKLLDAATQAFWDAGYSNTSLRQIAQAAEVDVALVSRYFGSKLGLFTAALEAGFAWPELHDPDIDPVAAIIAKFTDPATEDHKFSTTRMIIINANDPQVGDLVRTTLHNAIIAPLERRMTGPHAATRLALFFAAITGASIVRHSLQLPAMVDTPVDTYKAQLNYLIKTALAYGQDDTPTF